MGGEPYELDNRQEAAVILQNRPIRAPYREVGPVGMKRFPDTLGDSNPYNTYPPRSVGLKGGIAYSK